MRPGVKELFLTQEQDKLGRSRPDLLTPQSTPGRKLILGWQLAQNSLLHMRWSVQSERQEVSIS